MNWFSWLIVDIGMFGSTIVFFVVAVFPFNLLVAFIAGIFLGFIIRELCEGYRAKWDVYKK